MSSSWIPSAKIWTCVFHLQHQVTQQSFTCSTYCTRVLWPWPKIPQNEHIWRRNEENSSSSHSKDVYEWQNGPGPRTWRSRDGWQITGVRKWVSCTAAMFSIPSLLNLYYSFQKITIGIIRGKNKLVHEPLSDLWSWFIHHYFFGAAGRFLESRGRQATAGVDRKCPLLHMWVTNFQATEPEHAWLVI